jgi:hypothetical protein
MLCRSVAYRTVLIVSPILDYSSRGGKGRAMTTSVSPRAAKTMNPTRQQLDELDALLQRMLELPVQPLDKPDHPPSEEPAEEPPPPAVILGERPASAGRASSHQPADANRSPHQPVDAGRSPHQPADAGRSPPQPADAGRSTHKQTVRLTMPAVSYTVVETASPRPLPPASGFEPRPPMTKPRLVPVTPPATPAPPPAPEAHEVENWVPLRSTWQPSASTWPPLAESWQQANNKNPSPAVPSSSADLQPETPLPAPTTSASPLEAPVPLPSTETSLKTPNSNLETQSEPQLDLPDDNTPIAVPWPMLPLVWFNQGFDACLVPLGVPGRWLSGQGRVVLGFLGLACLAAAVALAVNAGMGWSR